MLSCQKYEKRDDEQGYHLYDAIRKFAPNYYLSVGDNVYYDSDYPVVNSTAIARHHWHRMFSLPRVGRVHPHGSRLLDEGRSRQLFE